MTRTRPSSKRMAAWAYLAVMRLDAAIQRAPRGDGLGKEVAATGATADPVGAGDAVATAATEGDDPAVPVHAPTRSAATSTARKGFRSLVTEPRRARRRDVSGWQSTRKSYVAWGAGVAGGGRPRAARIVTAAARDSAAASLSIWSIVGSVSCGLTTSRAIA